MEREVKPKGKELRRIRRFAKSGRRFPKSITLGKKFRQMINSKSPESLARKKRIARRMDTESKIYHFMKRIRRKYFKENSPKTPEGWRQYLKKHPPQLVSISSYT